MLLCVIVIGEMCVVLVASKPILETDKLRFRRGVAPEHNNINMEQVDERGIRPVNYDDYPVIFQSVS